MIASPLDGSAANPLQSPHFPCPRFRAATTVKAVALAATTVATPFAAATPDDNHAAILGALRQWRKAVLACRMTTRS